MVLFLALDPVRAADLEWNPAQDVGVTPGGAGDWDDQTGSATPNWVDVSGPAQDTFEAGDDVTFSGDGDTVTITETEVAPASIDFEAGGVTDYTITGGAIAVANNPDITSSTGASATIASDFTGTGDVSISGDLDLTLDNVTMTVDGTVEATTSGSVTISGDLTTDGASTTFLGTFDGNVINQGGLDYSGTDAVDGIGTLTSETGSTLDIAGTASVSADTVDLQSGSTTTVSGGTLTGGATSSNAMSLASVLTLSGGGTIDNDGDIDVTDVLTVSGDGALSTTGTINNSDTIDQTAGTLTITGDVSNTDTVDFAGTAVNGSGDFENNDAAAALTVGTSGTVTFDSITNTQGTITVTGTTLSAGSIDNAAGATIGVTNGTIEATTATTFSNSGDLTLADSTLSDAGTVTNTATGTITTTGTSVIESTTVGAIDNAGTIEQTSGDLTLTGTVANSGTIEQVAGTTTFDDDVANTGVLTFGGTSVSGAGVTNNDAAAEMNVNAGTSTFTSVTNTSGAVNIASGATLSAPVSSAGTLQNDGTLTGNLTVTGGTADNDATVTGNVQVDGGTFDNTSQVNGNLVDVAGTVTNSGTITGTAGVIAGGTFTNQSGGDLQSALTINGAGGAFTNDSGGSVDSVTVTEGTFTNNGTTAGTVDVAADGTLANGTAGTLQDTVTSEGTATNSGTISADVAVNDGTFTNDATGTITPAAQVTVAMGGTLDNAGLIDGNVDSAGDLDNSGTINGLVDATDGSVTNTGTLAGGLSLAAGVDFFGGGTISGTLTNAGGNTMTITSSNVLRPDDLINDGTIDVATDGGIVTVNTLQNNATGAINFNGPGGTATLENAGGDITNNGAILLDDGNLSVNSHLTGTGSVTVDTTGGTLTGQNITLGAGAALAVTDGTASFTTVDNTGAGAVLSVGTNGTLTATTVNTTNDMTVDGTHNGTININAGTTTNNGTLAGNSGAVNVANGATLTNNTGASVDGLATVQSGGTLDNDGGTIDADLTVNSGGTASGFGSVTGTATVSGTLTVDTGATLSAGTVDNSTTGSTTVDAGGTLEADTITNQAGGVINVGSGSTLSSLTNTISNSGTINVDAGGTVTDVGAITNATGGALAFSGVGADMSLNSDAGNITNQGSIAFTGSGLGVTGDIANTGTFSVAGGAGTTVTGQGIDMTGGGTLDVDSGTANFTTVTNGTGGITDIEAGATLGGAVTSSGDFDNAGMVTGAVTVDDGNFDNEAGGMLTSTLGVTGGTVANAATGTVTGAVTVGAAGTVTNDGDFSSTLATDGTTTNMGTVGGAVTVGAGTFDNMGTLSDTMAVNGGAAMNDGVVTGLTTVGAGGTLTNMGTGTLNSLTNDGTVSAAGIMNGTVTNNNAFTTAGAVTGTDTMNNTSTVTVSAGDSVALATALNNTGTVALGLGSSIGTAGAMLTNDSMITMDTGAALNGTVMNGSMLEVNGATAQVNTGGSTLTNSTGGMVNISDTATGERLTVDGGFVNDGMIDFTGADPDRDVRITGDLSGNGDINFASNFAGGAASNANTVSADGVGAGVQTVHVPLSKSNFGNNGQAGLGPDVVLIDGNGETVNFTPGDISALESQLGNPVALVLRNNAAGDAVVTSTVNTGAAAAIAGNLVLSQTIASTVVNRPSSPAVNGIFFEDEDNCSTGTWARAQGGNVSASADTTDPTLDVTLENDISATYYGIQGGADFGCYEAAFGGWDITGGVFFGVNIGSSSQDILSPSITPGGSGFQKTGELDVDFTQFSVGAYVAVASGQFFGDLQLRWDSTDFEFTDDPIVGEGLGLDKEKTDSTALTLAGSVNYTFALGETGFSVTPSAGFAYTRTSSSTLDLRGDSSIKARAYDTQLGFIGASIARSFVADDATSATTAFLTGTLYNDFAGDRKSDFRNSGEKRTLLSENLGSFGEVSAGFAYLKLLGENGPGGSKQFEAGLRADYRFSDDIDSTGLTGYLRLHF